MNKFFINGEIINQNEISFGPSLFSLNYAVCAFEGIRSYFEKNSGRTSIFRLDEHVERMLHSMNYLGMNSDYCDFNKIKNAIINTVIANGKGDLYIRPIAFYDEGIMSVKILPELNFCVMTFPFFKSMPIPKHRLLVSKSISDTSTLNYKISRNYFGSYMALKSVDVGDSTEVIQYDDKNTVSETSAHNIFFLMSNNKWVTPTEGSCLPGITRNTAIEILKKMSIDVQHKVVKLDDLDNVLACFLTSTAAEIVNVSSIEGRALNSEHPVIIDVINKYRALVSTDSEYLDKEWKTYV